MSEPSEILNIALRKASVYIQEPIVNNPDIVDRVEFVCRNIQNRAGVRLLLACLLAKIHNPGIDVRKPYTEIGDPDAFSGRTYDEAYVSAFINKHNLPCNSTTAFLTPALRNRNITLKLGVDLVGRPPKLYQTVLQLFDDVYTNKVSPEDLLAETIRCLLIFRNEKRQRMETLLSTLAELKSSIGYACCFWKHTRNLYSKNLKAQSANR